MLVMLDAMPVAKLKTVPLDDANLLELLPANRHVYVAAVDLGAMDGPGNETSMSK